MTKIIETSIGPVPFGSNAATPILCKAVFKIDIFKFFEEVAENPADVNAETMERIAFVMAASMNHSTREVLTMGEDEFLAWLMQFEFTEMIKGIIPKVMELWVESNETKIEQKNQAGPQ